MLSQYLANLFLDAVYGNRNFPPSLSSSVPIGGFPSQTYLYVALFTVMPGADGTGGTECAGTGYARAAVAQSTTNWPAASAGSKSNGAAISWGNADADWGAIIGWGIYDALTGGNLLHAGLLTQAQTPTDGDGFQCPAGQMVIQEA
jgi:hypothetical protein